MKDATMTSNAPTAAATKEDKPPADQACLGDAAMLFMMLCSTR